MLSVGGLTLDPIDYRAALACSLIPPPLSHQRSLQSAFPCGETTGFLRSPFRSFRGEVVPLGRWCTIRDGGIRSPRTSPLTFWFKPDSILGLFLVTAFISTSPGLTCPGLLAPDRRDAGSRRVGSRVHGRSEDRGYVVPQASDVSVAGDARWGSRPMPEHRVMSEDHLGLTHYRSRRCYESQPNCQRLNGAGSRRATPLYAVCHRIRRFVQTNQSVSPRSSPSDRRPFSLGWNRSTLAAPGVPAGWPYGAMPVHCLLSLISRNSPKQSGMVSPELPGPASLFLLTGIKPIAILNVIPTLARL